MNALGSLMQILSMGTNPQQIVQAALQRNPQMNAVLQQAKNSGMSMEAFTRQYAKQNGIDINPLINTMRQRGMM